MGYEKQMSQWLHDHPDATTAEAYKAGYMQSTDNWCRKERNVVRKKQKIEFDYDEYLRIYKKFN